MRQLEELSACGDATLPSEGLDAVHSAIEGESVCCPNEKGLFEASEGDGGMSRRMEGVSGHCFQITKYVQRQ